jgi:hypothetical protein
VSHTLICGGSDVGVTTGTRINMESTPALAARFRHGPRITNAARDTGADSHILDTVTGV